MMTATGRVMEKLLAGQFICKTSDEASWELLRNPGNRERIDSYLSQLNRCICAAADGEVFFCGYLQLGDDERKIVSQQFREICTSLMPMVEWLLLVQSASVDDAPLSEGAPVRLNELQTVIEDTPALREQLAKVSHYRLFGSTSTSVDGQLKQIFKRLCELGYLLRPNSEKQIYIASGKIDYLFEVIRFIDESEGLSLEEQADSAVQQGSLL